MNSDVFPSTLTFEVSKRGRSCNGIDGNHVHCQKVPGGIERVGVLASSERVTHPNGAVGDIRIPIQIVFRLL